MQSHHSGARTSKCCVDVPISSSKSAVHCLEGHCRVVLPRTKADHRHLHRPSDTCPRAAQRRQQSSLVEWDDAWGALTSRRAAIIYYSPDIGTVGYVGGNARAFSANASTTSGLHMCVRDFRKVGNFVARVRRPPRATKGLWLSHSEGTRGTFAALLFCTTGMCTVH